MDGLSNITNQTQQAAAVSQEKVNEKVQETKVQETKVVEQDLVKESQEESKNIKIDSQEDVETLVQQLNDAVEPMGTNLKFGVDKDDIYYVSVIDQKTDNMIRRFPAEKAADFLPKMLEVSGILFDSKV